MFGQNSKKIKTASPREHSRDRPPLVLWTLCVKGGGVEGGGGPSGPKKKLSRKAQLRELQRVKKQRREAADDRDYVPEPEVAENDVLRQDDIVADIPVEEPGADVKRMRDAERQRRCYKQQRLRGLDTGAQVMRAWLMNDEKNQEILEAQAIAEIGQSIVNNALEQAITTVEAEEEERARAAYAEAARARRAEHKRSQAFLSPPPRVTRDRPSSGRGSSGGNSRAGRIVVTDAMQASLVCIYKTRRFRRADVVGGDKLSRSEWVTVRSDPRLLKKFYCFFIYFRERSDGATSHAAYEAAGRSLTRRDGTPTYWNTVRHWLRSYVELGGKIQLDMRGHHTKTESYLEDPDVRAAATAWIRNKLRSMRQKDVENRSILTVDRFLGYVNNKLLEDIIQQDANRKPISRTTAHDWIERLGFSYCSHSKSIYFDGHERPDVVADRAEKLAVLKILDEVTVTYVGINCEEVC